MMRRIALSVLTGCLICCTLLMAADTFTPRQREILQLITDGQNTKQIGDILRISPKTVEYHRKKLMNSLNVFTTGTRAAMRSPLSFSVSRPCS